MCVSVDSLCLKHTYGRAQVCEYLERDKMIERRNDIGVKLSISILFSIIAGMLSIFFWGTYTRADIAVMGVQEVKIEQAVMKECISSISKKLDVITSYVVKQ
jgi:hypothetical protein